MKAQGITFHGAPDIVIFPQDATGPGASVMLNDEIEEIDVIGMIFNMPEVQLYPLKPVSC